METLKENLSKPIRQLNEAIYTAPQARVCANNTLTPAYIDQSGDVTVIFGKPFKMNDDSSRNRAIAYAKQCGYQLNVRNYTLSWPEFELEMKALYGDKYHNKYAVVIASTSPGTYMFFDALELVPMLSI